MKQKAIYAVIAVVFLGVGFFAGMEFKAYQVRTAFDEAFSGGSNNDDGDNNNQPETVMEQAKEDDMNIIQKNVGDEIALATIKVKVTGAEEKQTVSGSFGSPAVAKEGTKFVVVGLEVTNTTNSAFSLSPDFLLIDDKKREFSTYEDSIGATDDYLDYRELSPSVLETGVYIYEIPTDATSYSMAFAKAGSKDLYQVKLK